MRVLISGYYGFDNLGDEAILAALLQELARRHPDWTPVVLSSKPATTEQVYGVPAAARDSLLCMWEEMGRADLLLSGGGGLLQNVTSQLSLGYYLGLLQLALTRGTPYVILGQGLGPFFGPGVLAVVGRYLRKARAVVLRDSESVRLARQMGAEAHLHQAADLALLLEPAPAQTAASLLQSVGLSAEDRVVGLTLRGWGGKEPLDATVALCDHLHGEGYRCLLLPFQPEDRPLAWRLAAACLQSPAVLDAPLSPAEALSLVGTLTAFVTMRLHGLIFAASRMVPALGLAYDPKVYAFASEAGQPCLPLDQVTEVTLRVVVEDLLQSREEHAPARAEALKRLRAAAEVNLTVLDEVATALGQ